MEYHGVTQWLTGANETRYHVDDDLYTVSYPDGDAADRGLEALQAQGLSVLAVVDVGRVVVTYRWTTARRIAVL